MLSSDKNLLENLTVLTFINPITANLSFPASVRRPSSRNDQEGPENIGLLIGRSRDRAARNHRLSNERQPQGGARLNDIKNRRAESLALGSIFNR